jgi:hypothetical protein
MIDDNFFDYEEYQFFKELSDSDKLIYIYDVFINELSDEFFDELEFKEYNRIEPPTENFSKLASTELEPIEVTMHSDTNGRVYITSTNIDVINVIVSNMRLDGLILLNREETKINDKVSVSYKMLDGDPISLN